MNALKLAAISLVVCVALAPLIDALEAEDEEVVCHYWTRNNMYFKNCNN